MSSEVMKFYSLSTKKQSGKSGLRFPNYLYVFLLLYKLFEFCLRKQKVVVIFNVV